MGIIANFLIGFIILMVIIIAILTLLIKLKIIKLKSGKLAELRIKFLLGKSIPGKKYVFNNLMFLYDGKVSQIDHVVINRYGVFVIETKHWSGLILGSDENKKWTLCKWNKESTSMINPVKQNESHIKKLSNILELDKFFFRNMVVFMITSNISRVKSEHVYKSTSFTKHLKGDYECFSTDQLENLYKRLKEFLSIHGLTQKEFDEHYKNK